MEEKQPEQQKEWINSIWIYKKNGLKFKNKLKKNSLNFKRKLKKKGQYYKNRNQTTETRRNSTSNSTRAQKLA